MPGHGGARKGAGAKPKYMVEAKRNFAKDILSDDLERQMWVELLNATRITSVQVVGAGEEKPQYENITEPDNKIRLEALKFLCDHKHGKAAQSVKVEGDGEDGAVKLLLIGAKHV